MATPPNSTSPPLHQQHLEKLTAWRNCWVLQDMLRQLFADTPSQAQFKDANTFAQFLTLNRTYGTLQHSIQEKWNDQQSKKDKVPWNGPTKLWMNFRLQLRSQMNAREEVRWKKPTVAQLNKYQDTALKHNQRILKQIPELSNTDDYIKTVENSMMKYLKLTTADEDGVANAKLANYRTNSETILRTYCEIVVANINKRSALIQKDAVQDKFDYSQQQIPGT